MSDTAVPKVDFILWSAPTMVIQCIHLEDAP